MDSRAPLEPPIRMSAVIEAPAAAPTGAADLIDRGLEAARAIAAEEVRADHVAAWILRLARAAPERARALVPELEWDAGLRARALALIATGLLRRVDTALVGRSPDDR